MKKIKFESFFNIIKDKTFGFKGIPLNFDPDIFVNATAEFEKEKDPTIVVTNIESGFHMPYRKSTSEILFDSDNNEYILKTPDRKNIFKIY